MHYTDSTNLAVSFFFFFQIVNNVLTFVMIFSHINKKTCFTDPRLAFAEPLKTSPKDFRQKFDGNSSALQILNGRDLTGKYAIITGASDGIGKHF